MASTVAGECDVTLEMGDVSQKLLVPDKPNGGKSALFIDTDTPTIEFTGLTKEELMQYANDPKWKKIRIVLFVLFWMVWIGMLIAAIVIIVFAPKCPKRPTLSFWQKNEIYKLDPSLFLDTNNDNIGDFEGIYKKLNYLDKELRNGILLLDPVLSTKDNAVVAYDKTNEFFTVGEDNFQKLVKRVKKKGLFTVIGFDVVCTSKEHDWFKSQPNFYIKYTDSTLKNQFGKDARIDTNFYSAVSSSCPQLNLTNPDLLNKLKTYVQDWLKLGVDGFYLTNVAFIGPNFRITEPIVGLSTNKGQSHQNESIKFVKIVRSWLDDATKDSGGLNEYVLIVNTGNFSANPDYFISLYGNETEKGAHMVVDSTLSQVESFENFSSTVKKILSVNTEHNPKHLKGTAIMTQMGHRKRNFMATILSKTLPGTSISMYGEEYGLDANGSSEMPKMQWTPVGGFTNTTDNFASGEYNVMAQSAVGIDYSLLLLFRRLQNLTQEPSFRWGNFSWFNGSTSVSPLDLKENLIFYRHAEGFKSYLVVITKSSGLLQDYSSVCDSSRVVIAYPAGNFKPDEKIKMDKVFIKSTTGNFSFYVFECDLK